MRGSTNKKGIFGRTLFGHATARVFDMGADNVADAQPEKSKTALNGLAGATAGQLANVRR